MYPLPELTEKQSVFDVQTYLSSRFASPDFTMAEIGHDAVPVAFSQPTSFTGQQAYIGIEAWLRDPGGIKHTELAELRDANPGHRNVFFISHDVGGTVYRDYEKGESWLEGQYDAATVLPDGVADEVFISNVLSDPYVAGYPDRTDALLQEASRLLRFGGKLVLRHTITPEVALFTNTNHFTNTGLIQEGSYTPDDTEAWNQLETVYRAEPNGFKLPPNRKSHYLFFTKG